MEKKKKVWGTEHWVANTKDYCGKFLMLKEGFQSSYHAHGRKDETFYIINGKVSFVLTGSKQMLLPGDTIRIKPGEFHSFLGVRDSIILESSTNHSEDDVVRKNKSHKVKINYVDVDGFLCTDERGHYHKVRPLYKNIQKINKLYLNGELIIIWTARGATTGIDWTNLTEKQLRQWKVKYHDLRFTKPYFDKLWDDKAARF